MIVDTNALSAFAGGDQKIREQLANAAGPFLPVIVAGEYRYGLLNSRDREARLSWFERLSRQWVVLELTEATAMEYARIRKQLREAGTPIPSNDVWIAALASQHHLPVLSNDSHFDLVTGLSRIWT